MPGTLRRVVDAVCALAAIGLVVIVVIWASGQVRDSRLIAETQASLRVIERAIAIHSTTGGGEQSAAGFPATVDPAWFEDGIPKNLLLSEDRPWLEVAAADQHDLKDPPMRAGEHQSLASFWYNPASGVVRARVPHRLSEEASVDLYNRVNGASITAAYVPIVPSAKPAPTEGEGAQTAEGAAEPSEGAPMDAAEPKGAEPPAMTDATAPEEIGPAGPR